MNPGISEFSYGYAVTEALVRGKPGLTAAPIFPSLVADPALDEAYARVTI
jgi:hypothetical protein